MSTPQTTLTDWDVIYLGQGVIQSAPSRAVQGLVPLLHAEGVNRLLDHCCGTGRHASYLTRQGFSVTATDSSRYGLALAQQTCEGLAVDFLLCEMGALPIHDASFDAILAVQALQFGSREQRAAAGSEILRTLRPGGILYVSVLSDQHPLFGCGTPVVGDPNSFTGLPLHGGFRHFFSAAEVRDAFGHFEIQTLEHHVGEAPTAGYFQFPLHEYRMIARKPLT